MAKHEKKTADELADLRPVELRTYAREVVGIENWDRYSKQELLEAIRDHENKESQPASNAVSNTPRSPSRPPLKST